MGSKRDCTKSLQASRIVTRPDFDGIVCAMLLKDVLDIDEEILWVEPSSVQNGEIRVQPGDILANLPFQPGCALWFDHHVSNAVDFPFEGLFEVAPSAAGLVHRYYKGGFSKDFSVLVAETDRIDSADLVLEEVLQPEKNPYLLLSMTVDGGGGEDRPYWKRLVDLLGSKTIAGVMADEQVQRRCRKIIVQNEEYKKLLLAHTTIRTHIAVTDFRPLSFSPKGNRFLVYSLFPECIVHIKIRYVEADRLGVSIGHSIFRSECRVNIGLMLSGFGGGGHRGAGGARFSVDKGEEYIRRMIEILLANQPNEPE